MPKAAQEGRQPAWPLPLTWTGTVSSLEPTQERCRGLKSGDSESTQHALRPPTAATPSGGVRTRFHTAQETAQRGTPAAAGTSKARPLPSGWRRNCLRKGPAGVCKAQENLVTSLYGDAQKESPAHAGPFPEQRASQGSVRPRAAEQEPALPPLPVRSQAGC